MTTKTTKITTFTALCESFRKQYGYSQAHGSLTDRIDCILDQARINADDTVFVERARPEADYDAIALDTVRSLLAYSTDRWVKQWFATRGIVG